LSARCCGLRLRAPGKRIWASRRCSSALEASRSACKTPPSSRSRCTYLSSVAQHRRLRRRGCRGRRRGGRPADVAPEGAGAQKRARRNGEERRNGAIRDECCSHDRPPGVRARVP
jgi:hypothetical protein